MAVLARMLIDATMTLAPLAEMEIRGYLEEPGGGYDPAAVLLIDGELDTALGEAARPRADRRQIVAPLRIILDGEVIEAGRLLPASVDLALGRPAGWSVSYPVRSGWEYDSPMGGGLDDFYGPPPGKGAIDIEGVYLTPAGPRTVRLVTNGVVVSGEETEGPGGDVDALAGGDALLRVDQKLITLVLPPGHGLSRGAVGARVLNLLGLTSHSLAAGGTCYKEIPWIDERGLSALEQFFGVESRVVQADPYGTITNPRAVLDEGQRVDWTFSRGDLLGRAGVKRSGTNDGPTRITLTGSRQLVRDACGRRTGVPQESLQIGDKLPLTAAYRQQADGSLLAYTPAIPPTLITDAILTRTLITTEYDCDTVISERVEEWAWFNPKTWRYRLNGSTTTYGFGEYNPAAYLMDAGAASGDATEAFLWPQERFVKVRDTVTTHHFDAAGYKTSSTVTVHGWVLPRWHVKESGTPSPSWDLVNWQPVRILAGGDGVGPVSGTQGGTEYWTGIGLPVGPASQPYAEITAVTYQNTDDGYRLFEGETVQRIQAEEGGRDSAGFVHLYNGNREKDAERETLRVAEIRETRYLPDGEAQHVQLSSRTKANGDPLEPAKIEKGVAGYLPAAERRNDDHPDATIYDTPEEAAAAKAASRFESQPIKATVESPLLAAFREEWEQKEGVTWAETREELEALGIDRLRKLSALGISYELPANFLIRPGQAASIPFRRRAVVHLVTRVNHTQSTDGITTKVEGDVYVI